MFKSEAFKCGTLYFGIQTFSPAMLPRLAHGGRRGMAEDAEKNIRNLLLNV